MITRLIDIRHLLITCLMTVGLFQASAEAQLKEVVVGITTTCPYENAIEGGCWSGAYWALTLIDGVGSVDELANGYNCTARLYFNDGVFPDPEKISAQFKKGVGDTYAFRGIEVTVIGTVQEPADNLSLGIPGVEQSLPLAPLEHKLQWNARKGTARQPEPDERDAYRQLVTKMKDAGPDGSRRLHVTGPLLKSNKGVLLEVREFFVLDPEPTTAPAK